MRHSDDNIESEPQAEHYSVALGAPKEFLQMADKKHLKVQPTYFGSCEVKSKNVRKDSTKQSVFGESTNNSSVKPKLSGTNMNKISEEVFKWQQQMEMSDLEDEEYEEYIW